MIDKRYHDFVIKRSRITQQFLEVVKFSAFQAFCAPGPQQKGFDFSFFLPILVSFCRFRRIF
jgi:hypothetical protein